jgi:glycosyltransferase involved in cell wall biosynthesis
MSAARLASIIISSYNYGRFLKYSIDSALQQTYRNTEVIVVDDGSTDDSAEVIASYDGRLISLVKKNGGQASALNAGFALSRGEVVLFLDSDDVLAPTAVDSVLKVFDAPKVAKAHWKLPVIDEAGRQTGQVRPHYCLAEGDLLEDRIRNGVPYYGDWPATSGNAWSRRLLDRILPIPETEFRTCPDIYLSVLAPVFGLIRRLEEPQSYYREHGRNHWDDVSLTDFVKMLDCSYAALRDHLRALGFEASIDEWRKKSWLHQVYQARQELAALVPKGECFILVDQDELRPEIGPGFATLPFLEHCGYYGGPPADDETAINEVERLRQAGARFIAFAWPAFWWLDYYAGLHRHLRSTCRPLLDNARLVVFELPSSAGVAATVTIAARSA